MNRQEEEIRAKFTKLVPSLKKWGEYVDSVLTKEILNGHSRDNIVKIFPSHRIKEEISFLSKALYRRKLYNDPFVDIEDKVGTRIVVLKSNDIEIVSNEIMKCNKWQAKITKDIQQEIEDKPHIFDYQSLHIVVWPSEDDPLFEKEIKSHLTCEIQIRTLLQHAFAEVSHDSTYKGPYKNDKGILRHLSKSMALMEATDDYFCNIFELMSDEKRYYTQYLKEIIELYTSFNTFDRQDLDYFVTDSIFELLERKNVELSSLNDHVEKHRERLAKMLKSQNNLLFKQPVILLIDYYFDNHRSILGENWPLNEEALKSIYFANNTSFKSY